MVAVLNAELLNRLLVRAPAVLVLQDSVGEFALALVVASTQRLIDVGTWELVRMTDLSRQKCFGRNVPWLLLAPVFSLEQYLTSRLIADWVAAVA